MEPYVGEIRMFAGDYAPEGWALCDGRELEPSVHEALFALIGASYGGDGKTGFALPDLRGRVPVGQGARPGLSPRTTSAAGGAETVSLTVAQLPSHTHSANVTTQAATTATPGPEVNIAATTMPTAIYLSPTSPIQSERSLNLGAVSAVGNGAPHANMMPSFTVNYIIALVGSFPPAS